MYKEFLKSIKYYLLAFIILFILSIIFSVFFSVSILKIDDAAHEFINAHIVNDTLTNFFKVITHFGSVYFYLALIALFLVIIKNRKISLLISINLVYTWILNNIIKNVLRRERPLINLITKPMGFSFPSGHAMCSIAFYGMLIYIINKKIKNKKIVLLLDIFLSLIILLIVFSRIYLNVHYTTDILFGCLFGFLSLKISISYGKLYNVIGDNYER